MYNPAVTYASCNTSSWGKRLVWEQASKNLNAAPALVVLCFPICQIGEIIWKGLLQIILFLGYLFRSLLRYQGSNCYCIESGAWGKFNGGRKILCFVIPKCWCGTSGSGWWGMNNQRKSPVPLSPCALGSFSWHRSILFSKQQKPKNPKVQDSAHRIWNLQLWEVLTTTTLFWKGIFCVENGFSIGMP